MKVCTDSCLFGSWVAGMIQHHISPKNILDIGTGTGLLSLMLAQKSRAEIHAIDIDTNSVEQAAENFSMSPWPERMQVFHADIKEWRPVKKYDLIIANPPFYENDLVPANTGKAVSKHSSTLRLEDLLSSVKKLLNENGSFALLLSWARAAWFEDAALASSLFVKEKTEVRQTPLHQYFRAMLLLQKHQSETLKNELTIKNHNNEYTHECIKLLKDYYLYL